MDPKIDGANHSSEYTERTYSWYVKKWKIEWSAVTTAWTGKTAVEISKTGDRAATGDGTRVARLTGRRADQLIGARKGGQLAWRENRNWRKDIPDGARRYDWRQALDGARTPSPRSRSATTWRAGARWWAGVAAEDKAAKRETRVANNDRRRH